MRACVSGQAGVVVTNDGEKWYLLDSASGSPVPIRRSSAARLLEGSTDIVDIDPRRAAFELERQQAKDTAFQYLLTLLGEGVVSQIEQRMLERLKHFLSFSQVSEHILNRLYAATLDETSLGHANLLIAQDGKHPVAKLLRRIVAAQPLIGSVRAAWETVSAGKFRSPVESDGYFLTAVDTGVVRKLVLHLGGGKDSLFRTKDRIVKSWMEIARDSQGSRTVHRRPDQTGVSQAGVSRPRETSGLFDENYLQALARRDPEAEHFLVEHFSRPVQFKLSGRLRSKVLVQEAHQETFLRIFRYFNSGKTLDDPASLPGFVHGVCHQVVLDFRRSGMRYREMENAPETVDSSPGPEAHALTEQRRKLVKMVLGEMPARDRELLRRVCLDEEDKDSVCRDCGVDRSYLRVLLYRARKSNSHLKSL